VVKRIKELVNKCKNIIKKKMKNFILLLTFTLFLSSCHKDEIPTCGCDSPTVGTVTNEIGVLKKNSGNFKNSDFDTEYYIEYVVGNYSSYFGICNSDKLNGIAIPENTEVSVIYSGDIKEMCNGPVTIAVVSHDLIKLTQIQKQ